MASALTVTGLDKVLEDIADLEGNASDLSDVWPIIGRLWQEREQRWFASGGNGSWPPLSAAALVKGRAPLVETGALIRDLTQTTPRYESPSTAVYGPPKGAGAARDYGHWHVVGTAYMPARKPVPRLTAAERRAMVKAIREHLMKGVD